LGVLAPRTVIGLLLALLPSAALAADPYVFVEGGVAWSFDRSNNDEVEFGDEPGGSLAVGIGRRYRIADRWSIDGEAQIIGQVLPLHGRNDQREATADGREFWLAGLTLDGWAAYALDERWSLYAGGGAGPAVITAFGSSAATAVLIGGGGVRYDPGGAIGLDVGGRYYWTAPTRVNGAESRYDGFGPSFRLTYFFDGRQSPNAARTSTQR
jgi:hypothetical protein